MTPNTVTFRLNDEDKRALEALQSHYSRKVGTELPTTSVFRLALKALVAQHSLKVAK
jgi:hypothetical protein